MITGVAYMLASLGANAVIPARIVPFLAIILGLVGVAHIAVRLLARGADGTLLPLVALLHGIGYVMITRLDQRPRRPAGHVEPGRRSAAFVATLLFVQRATDLARYKWTLFLVGAVLLLMPMVPGLGYSVGRRRDLGRTSGRSTSSPASSPSWRSRSSSPATSPSVAS